MDKKQLIIASAILIVGVIIGFFSGQEYTKRRIAEELKESFANAFGESTIIEDKKEKNLVGTLGTPIDFNGVVVTLLEIKRFENVGMKTTDGEQYDSAVNFKIKIENNTETDYYYNGEFDVSLLSKVLTNKITRIENLWGNDGPEVLKPKLGNTTLIPGASIEGYITYYMVPEIKNTDLELRINIDNKKASYKFEG